MQSVAVISDLHGNLTAFRAVLADIDARGITDIVGLGDVAGKGPRGSACVALSRERCAVTVRGNWDDFLPVEKPGVQDEAIAWWRNELAPGDGEWLRALPFSHDRRISGRNIRFFHASSTSVYTRVHFRHSDEEFARMFAATDATGPGGAPDVVCYGDIHDAYLEVSEGRMLVNAGSVGNALDEPSASYLIMEGVPGGDRSDPFGVQFVRVAYDIEAEIAVAAELGMPQLTEYATELRTAVFRGRQLAR